MFTTPFVLIVILTLVLIVTAAWRNNRVKPVRHDAILPNIIEYPSPNFDDRRTSKPNILVLHYTATKDTQEALDILTNGNRSPRVSCHYLVDEDGKIYRLVAENKRAWHAGLGYWGGQRDTNGYSFGIEIQNTGEREFPKAQMESVKQLCLDILSRHKIPAYNVIGHSDVAPERKPDPGHRFDWRGLAAARIGIVAAPEKQDYDSSARWSDEDFRRALTTFGYSPDDDFEKVVIAFQRHHQQEVFQTAERIGKADAETHARLAHLIRQKTKLLKDCGCNG